jgi:hypothetical protein
MNLTRDTFRSLFEDDLQLLRSPTCARCDAQLRHPLLPWIVGEHFRYSPERILFVGKPHRGEPGEILPSGMIDATQSVSDELWKIRWAYWRYTREIAENLYGANAADFIAFTNLIKCTNNDASPGAAADRTTLTMANCCVTELGVIWKEVQELQPFNIVFYTYRLFPEVLRSIPVALQNTVQEITPQQNFVTCRNKRLGWWERVCRTSWTDKLRILVVGHPERMARAEFVRLLTKWLRP